jgi:hypothetical protein
MSKFKKVTREEKIQKLVETQDVHCDIQIRIKYCIVEKDGLMGNV